MVISVKGHGDPRAFYMHAISIGIVSNTVFGIEAFLK